MRGVPLLFSSVMWLRIVCFSILFFHRCKGKAFKAEYKGSCGVGCSKFRYKSDIKSARIQLVKFLTFNTLYCEIVI